MRRVTAMTLALLLTIALLGAAPMPAQAAGAPLLLPWGMDQICEILAPAEDAASAYELSFAPVYGAPLSVYAPGVGVVTDVQGNPALGFSVALTLSGGLDIAFSGLARADVAPGQPVDAQTAVGLMGAFGAPKPRLAGHMAVTLAGARPGDKQLSGIFGRAMKDIAPGSRLLGETGPMDCAAAAQSAVAVAEPIAGAESTFELTTNQQTTRIRIYDAAGALLAEQRTGYTQQGMRRVWKVSHTFAVPGEATLQFAAGNDAGFNARMVSSRVKVAAGGAGLIAKASVVSASAEPATVQQSQAITFTVVTSKDTTSVKVTTETGSTTLVEATSGYTEDATTRTWKLNTKIAGAGNNRQLRVYAGSSSGYTTAYSTVTVTVLALTVTKIEYTPTAPVAGEVVTVRVYTNANVSRVKLLNTKNQLIKELVDNYTTAGTERVWTYNLGTSAGGLVVRQIAVGSEVGYNEAMKTFSFNVLPKAAMISAASAVSTVYSGVKVKYTLVTTKATTRISLNNKFGTALKSITYYTAAMTPKVYVDDPNEDRRTWTFEFTLNTAGSRTLWATAGDPNVFNKTALPLPMNVLPLAITGFKPSKAKAFLGEQVTFTMNTPAVATQVRMLNEKGGAIPIPATDISSVQEGDRKIWTIKLALTSKGVRILAAQCATASAYFKSVSSPPKCSISIVSDIPRVLSMTSSPEKPVAGASVSLAVVTNLDTARVKITDNAGNLIKEVSGGSVSGGGKRTWTIPMGALTAGTYSYKAIAGDGASVYQPTTGGALTLTVADGYKTFWDGVAAQVNSYFSAKKAVMTSDFAIRDYGRDLIGMIDNAIASTNPAPTVYIDGMAHANPIVRWYSARRCMEFFRSEYQTAMLTAAKTMQIQNIRYLDIIEAEVELVFSSDFGNTFAVRGGSRYIAWSRCDNGVFDSDDANSIVDTLYYDSAQPGNGVTVVPMQSPVAFSSDGAYLAGLSKDDLYGTTIGVFSTGSRAMLAAVQDIDLYEKVAVGRGATADPARTTRYSVNSIERTSWTTPTKLPVSCYAEYVVDVGNVKTYDIVVEITLPTGAISVKSYNAN